MPLLSLPDILIVDELKRNPHAEDVEALATSVSEELDIKLDNFHEYNTMSAYLFPTANRHELLAIIMLNNLLFYIDDLLDRNLSGVMDSVARRSLFEDIIYVFKTGKIKNDGSRLQAAAFGIRELFVPYADPRWLQRLIANTQKHFVATTYDVSDIKQTATGFTIQKYIEVREHDSGMVPTVDLIEFANNFYLADDFMNDPVIRQAISCCTRSAALMNDIFSYEKEVIDLDSKFNLVAVVMESMASPFEEAVDHSIMLINREIQTFIDLKDKLPESEEALKFYNALSDQINAAWHWQYVGTNRYRSSNSPFKELQYMLELDNTGSSIA